MVLTNEEKEYLIALKNKHKINIDYAMIEITFTPEYDGEIIETPKNYYAILLLKKDKNKLKSTLKADGKKGLQTANRLLSKVCFSSEVSVFNPENIVDLHKQDAKDFDIKINNFDKIILI